MFFHACQMDQRRIVVNSMNRRRFENKNCWRIGHDPSMENWKGLTVANNTKRRNKENYLTFAGSCGRDFNACLFWIDWKGRTELLLNKKIFMLFLIQYRDLKKKTLESEKIRANKYDELLNKVKELMGDNGEIISIVRIFEWNLFE